MNASSGNELFPPQPLKEHILEEWMLDPAFTFLNHGSFGARSRSVHEIQRALHEAFERQPVQSIVADFIKAMPGIVESVAAFMGTTPESIAMVSNASEAINSILRSCRFSPGDEIITTNHGYNAVIQALRFIANRTGATLHEVDIPVPIKDPADIINEVESRINEQTRLLLIDHITSPTALVFPIERLVRTCRQRGIDVLIDGAHGPGMLPMQVDELGPTWYVGNLHKWVSAPIGAACIVTEESRRGQMHPAVISHGYQEGYEMEFAWQGTRDYTPWFCVPHAIQWIDQQYGWDAVHSHNHQMAAWAHAMLVERWGVEPASPLDGSMLGSMAMLALPDAIRRQYDSLDPLHDRLYEEFHVEVPIMDWKNTLWIRISAHVYNVPGDYSRLAEAIEAISAG